MNSFKCLVIFSVVFGLTAAGHFHHDHGHGQGEGGGVAVHYTVVTEHKADHQAYEGHHGHGHGHGGHDDGHASVHTWGQDDGHSAGGHDGGYSGGHDGGHDDHHDHHAYPKYDYSYGIKDPKTGDIKSQSETRDGSSVKGSYTVKEADGTTRHVEYTADKHKGFNAVVHTTGNAHGGAHGAEHGHDSYGHGHGKASSFVIVNKQEEDKKH